MRALVQRVQRASVVVDGVSVGEIGPGLLVFLGIKDGDDQSHGDALAEKVAGLRIFADNTGKMNLSVAQKGGEILVVSQFTLYGDTSKGRRPNFTRAARPDTAKPLYNAFVRSLKDRDIPVETGRFGADMDVSLINDGPVTLIIDAD